MSNPARVIAARFSSSSLSSDARKKAHAPPSASRIFVSLLPCVSDRRRLAAFRAFVASASPSEENVV
jgi:hypothetical protein